MKNIRKIGEAGVDAGMLMVVDPCYVTSDDKEWTKFCRSLDFSSTSFEFKDGVGCPTVHGDGLYRVFTADLDLDDGEGYKKCLIVELE